MFNFTWSLLFVFPDRPINMDVYIDQSIDAMNRVGDKYHGLVYISIITISFIAITGILPDFIKVEIKKENFPDKTFTYLKEHKIEGNILNRYGWGGYLIYKMPEKKVFIDGRKIVFKDLDK